MKRSRKFAGFFLSSILVSATDSLACTGIKDEAERLACYDAAFSEAKFLRCFDAAGSALCEILTPEADGTYSCTAFNKNNEPVANTLGMGGAGVLFNELDAATIETLACRKSAY